MRYCLHSDAVHAAVGPARGGGRPACSRCSGVRSATVDLVGDRRVGSDCRPGRGRRGGPGAGGGCVHTEARSARSSVPPQTAGPEVVDLEPRLGSHRSRSGTPRRVTAPPARSSVTRREALPDRHRDPVVVDQHRFDAGVGPQLLEERVGDGDPGDLRRAAQGQVHLHPRPGRQRRRLGLRVGLLTQLHQRVGGPVLEAVPRLTLRRLRLLGQPLDRRFERARPSHPATARADAACLCPVSTTSATTAPHSGPANPRSTVSTHCVPAGPAHRRDHVGSPARPLRIAELVRQLRHRAQLLHRSGHPRTPPLRPRATTPVRVRSRACPASSAATHRWSQVGSILAALVEHPQHVELLVLNRRCSPTTRRAPYATDPSASTATRRDDR